MDLRTEFFTQEGETFYFLHRVQTALGPTRHSIQKVLGALVRDMKLTIHLLLVRGLRICGLSLPLP